jgi:hypothetical protein
MWHYLSNFFILVLILYVLVYIFACFLQEEDLLRTFNKQVEEDRKIVISRSNLNELHKVGTHCKRLFHHGSVIVALLVRWSGLFKFQVALGNLIPMLLCTICLWNLLI